MTNKKSRRLGRPPSGIARRPMTFNVPVVLTDHIKQYTADYGESGSNLIARLLAEFFRTDGTPPGNIRSTLKRKLKQLD